MKQSIFYISEKGNTYLYDNNSRISMLVHPDLKKNHDGFINSDSYYRGKYDYLKEYGFFNESQVVDFLSLEESIVRNNVVDTQQIVFETTDSCNLNCTYCALGDLYDGADEKIDKKIDVNYAINLVKYVFDFIPVNRKKKIYISFYGGEALLNFDFIKQIVELVNQLNVKKNIEVRYSMTTNATLIHKYIDFLVVNDFSILVSLDGNGKNHSYRSFKGNGKNSFATVIANLDLIQQKYPEYFYRRINLNAVLHDRNSIKEIMEFIYNRYKIIPRVAELNLRDVRKDQEDTLKRMYRSKRRSELEYQKEHTVLSEMIHSQYSVYRELVSFLKVYTINYYVSNINALLCAGEIFLPTCTCSPFSKKIFMTVHNKLLPCEKINYKYSLGKVGDNVEIDLSDVTKRYNVYYKHLSKSCRKCYAYRFCGTCFFQLDNIDLVEDNKFVCEKFYGEDDFRKKISYLFSFMEKYPMDFSDILENVIME